MMKSVDESEKIQYNTVYAKKLCFESQYISLWDWYIKNVIDELIITFDEIVDSLYIVIINANDKKETYNMDYYILHNTLLVTILLLTVVDVCYYCTQHWLKQNNITTL